MKRIGIIGTGFIATGLFNLLEKSKEYSVSKVLTRTKINLRTDFPNSHKLTNTLVDLITNSDLIVECSGDAIHATENIDKILKASIPVVTMNSEFHITTGSYFIGKGLITEAEGDQPGSLAQLHEDVVAMGFKPLVYGNIKGFLNTNPSEEDMKFWSNKSGIAMDMTTSFTDGTKVQIEQVFVANGFNATIAKEGLIKLNNDDMKEGGSALALYAKELNQPISDYLLSPKLPAGVFIVAEHDAIQADQLRYYKMGDGPYYVIERPFHLCHLEILKTISRVLRGDGVLLDNGNNPQLSVGTIAKKDLSKGTHIEKGIGSFEVRGEAIKIANHPNHLPIGLCANVTLKRAIKAGEMLSFEDVVVPETLALEAWNSIIKTHNNQTLLQKASTNE